MELLIKLKQYEHTTEFGNRNKDTVADFLKDSCEGNIDENYNLSNGYSYLFITYDISLIRMEMISRLKVIRNAGVLYAIKDDMERIQENSDCVYIDNYWLGGDESDSISLCFRQRRVYYIRAWIYYSG